MNKLMIRHTMDKPLPYDAEVEWVASDGNTVVDTLIAPNTLTNYHLVFSNWAMKRDVNFFAALDFKNNVYEFYRELSVGHTDLMRSEYSRASQLQWLPTSNIANVKFSITKVGFEIIYHNYSTGSEYANSVTPSSYQWTGTLKLFGTDVYPTMIMSARLHPSYLTDENGNKIGDYIPVRKDGKGYLYDKISKQLLPNIGPGLIIGPDYNPFAYQYLTFVPLEDSTFSFSKRGTGNDIEYSIDGGIWTSLASEANTPTVGAGHNIRWRAELGPKISGEDVGIGTFAATGLYDAMGNIMSLQYGDNYIGKTTGYAIKYFYKLFANDTHLYRCSNLILPLAELDNRTYAFMFQNCTSLIIAPTLPASVLATFCYYAMFQKCTKLQYIKMLATDISASSCLRSWVSGVSSTGTLVKNAAMITLPTGSSGIPSGWTVVDDNS